MSLPISLHLDGRRAVIVGGGAVAYRKARTLAGANARLCVISPTVDERLRKLVLSRGDELFERRYASGDLNGSDFVVVATDDAAVNATVVSDARHERVLCCNASDARDSDATIPAIAYLSNISIAVDTGGQAPALARRFARELREHFGGNYSRAVATFATMRAYAKSKLPQPERSTLLRSLAQQPIEELAAMDRRAAEQAVETAIAQMHDAAAAPRQSVVCASRASALALKQTRTVAAALARRGIGTTILTLTTTGDREQDRPLYAIGENVFVKELQRAVRDGRADYAVHSCKDLSSTPEPDLSIAAISAREDPRDVFCSERYAHFADLPAGSVVGTSSPRRRAQLAALRADLRYDDLRGNVDTRLRKLREGDYDAIVLASAGLKRLGSGARHVVPFSVDEIVPAAGQGALAIEVRAGDELGSELRAAVNDAVVELCVACERATLRALRAGCSAPVGVHAAVLEGKIEARACYAAESGALLLAHLWEPAADLTAAERLGERLAAELRAQNGTLSIAGRIVVLPRTQHRSSRIGPALRAAGAQVFELRDGAAAPDALGERVPDMLLFPSSGCVAAAGPFLESVRRGAARPAVAAMGPQSADAARRAGFEPDVIAAAPSVDAFVEAVTTFFHTGAQRP